MRRYAFVVAQITSIALITVGCTRHVPHPPYVGQPTSALVEVPFPPPPARVEVVPPRPTARSVWIDGEWSWHGRKWAWKAGRWVVPTPGTAFAPWTTVRGLDGTLFFAPGAWRDAHGEVVVEPIPLATGASDTAPAAPEDATPERGAPQTGLAPPPPHHPADPPP